MTDTNKRKHFRLEFPRAERPRLVTGEFELTVLEVSEGGCSVEVADEDLASFPKAGIKISGDMVFSDGDRLAIEGSVLRLSHGNRLAIRFSKGLTFAKMMAEHRRILAKHQGK